jgi:hypothetical protein
MKQDLVSAATIVKPHHNNTTELVTKNRPSWLNKPEAETRCKNAQRLTTYGYKPEANPE